MGSQKGNQYAVLHARLNALHFSHRGFSTALYLCKI
jgi:hypothetical protein